MQLGHIPNYDGKVDSVTNTITTSLEREEAKYLPNNFNDASWLFQYCRFGISQVNVVFSPFYTWYWLLKTIFLISLLEQIQLHSHFKNCFSDHLPPYWEHHSHYYILHFIFVLRQSVQYILFTPFSLFISPFQSKPFCWRIFICSL